LKQSGTHEDCIVTDTNPNTASEAIAADCAAAILELDPRVAQWLRSHVIPPKRISLARKTDGSDTRDFWLVTDHTGTNDASFRVVYDDASGRYGIECAILNSISLFIGYRATLAEAVTDIKFIR
jgi:hypothetical protein